MSLRTRKMSLGSKSNVLFLRVQYTTVGLSSGAESELSRRCLINFLRCCRVSTIPSYFSYRAWFVVCTMEARHCQRNITGIVWISGWLVATDWIPETGPMIGLTYISWGHVIHPGSFPTFSLSIGIKLNRRRVSESAIKRKKENNMKLLFERKILSYK